MKHSADRHDGGIADDSFDLVVTIFGAMFAPTLVAQVPKLSAAYTPPPSEGFVGPMTWGVKTREIERFAAAGITAPQIACVRDSVRGRRAVGQVQGLLRAATAWPLF